MKKFLLLTVFAGIFSWAREVRAQCTVSNIIIQNVTVVSQTGSSCTVRFDVSFNIENNNGNKFIFIHAWLQSNYPNYFQCVNGQSTINGAIRAPRAGDLNNPFLTIGINNSGATPVLLTSYTPDPSVPITPVSSIQRQVLPDGSANIILTGVTTTLPVACGTPVVIIADVWSSQSAQAQVAHCVNCGISYSAGFITATGFVNCATLTYSATLTNNTGAPINGFYRVFADINHDGIFTPAIDTLIAGPTNFSIAAGPGTTTPISGSVPPANLNQDLFLVITQTSGQASGASRVIVLPSTECGPLPVTFRSFTADRTSRSAVSLRWETATELNNRGFAIQRSTGGNLWTTLTFVPSRATGGNSDQPIVYTYTDMNDHNGITQYRIRQVDLDNKATLSEIRAVRGYGQKSNTIIYPNPTSTGSTRVVFDSGEGVRDVTLADAYGRILRRWTGVRSNTLEIRDLQSGMYTVNITVRGTGRQTVEKILVNPQ